jgi:arylsulfatase A-like enzyme
MRSFSAFVLCLLLCAAACGPEAVPRRPPNIVLIVGDDHGYRDFGFMGSEIAETPNLDRLAAGGVVFPLGYATASVCRPSLRSLLTGLHPLEFERFEQRRIRQGSEAVPKTPLSEMFQTLPALLAERGYASFQSGKFQEGHFENAGFTHGMTRTTGKAGRKQGIRIARETMDPVYQFIDQHREQPFFLWFAPQLPHLPHNPPERFRKLYSGRDLPWFAPGYYASVSWFDESVGHLVDHLAKRGLSDDTVIVYLADNGWQAPGAGVEYDFVLGGHQGKMSLYEDGFRTPLIFNWPGRIGSPRTDDALISSVDLFPTLLGIAGARLPVDREGRDLRPLLDGEAQEARAELIGTASTLRSDTPDSPMGGSFLRNRRWHYLSYNDGRQALFDLEKDPDERHDIADEHSKLVERFRKRIRTWISERTAAADRNAQSATAF